MEKTTKKRKKSKRLKKRIGLIAIGGLSLVLTISLSIGATLAWFAGSTWASNQMFMGGPVYIEMAGRGDATGSMWTGGEGKLDIIASQRTTGTSKYAAAGAPENGTFNADGKNGYSNILLPGQKLLIYSQARVYSTLYDNTTADTVINNQSSGANTSNISGVTGTTDYKDRNGRVRTATTSVVRAKFSINVEFDPYMGFNNFTDTVYASNYPTKSTGYTGETGTTIGSTTLTAETALPWQDAYAAAKMGTANGRRDAVINSELSTNFISGEEDKGGEGYDASVENTPLAYSQADLTNIKASNNTSMYEWKYVSLTEYNKAIDPTVQTAGGKLQDQIDAAAAKTGAATGDTIFVKMGKPFDGTVNSIGGNSKASGASDGTGNGFYGVWVAKLHKASGTSPDTVNKLNYQESEAFYKARTTAYMNSYIEHYVDEYNRQLVLTTKQSLNSLENALNTSFENLVNQSSDNIIAGNIEGFTVDDFGNITYIENKTNDGINASWLYVDPTVGNDTNAGSSTTSMGGWWYLVSSNGSTIANGNQVNTIVDNVVRNVTPAEEGDPTTQATGITYAASMDSENTATYNANAKYENEVMYKWTGADASATADLARGAYNLPKAGTATYGVAPFQRDTYTGAGSNKIAKNSPKILTAQLYEVKPETVSGNELVTGSGVTKVVSQSFPFVNGSFQLPGRELTNIFANAKITFQISFQALQAFFPFTPSIDGIPEGHTLAGTGKALNIGNAIPIFNEAFDYLTVL